MTVVRVYGRQWWFEGHGALSDVLTAARHQSRDLYTMVPIHTAVPHKQKTFLTFFVLKTGEYRTALMGV